jgi:hypothetical protein
MLGAIVLSGVVLGVLLVAVTTTATTATCPSSYFDRTGLLFLLGGESAPVCLRP